MQVMRPYCIYVASFVRHQEVSKAARIAPGAGPFDCCIKETSIGVSDPAIWYASILPESAEADDGSVAAVDVLTNYRGERVLEARMLRLSLQLYLNRGDEPKAEATARALALALKEARDTRNATESFTYQFASDYLGSHFVRFCQPRE